MAARATHVFPVVRKRTTTDAADLLVLAAQTAMRPGEPVRAESDKEALQEIGRQTDFAPVHYDRNGHGLEPRSRDTAVTVGIVPLHHQ
jgi:hypothetical protein